MRLSCLRDESKDAIFTQQRDIAIFRLCFALTA